MVLETNKENLNINKVVCEKEETIYVEGDMIVPDSKPDILTALNTSGNICIYKKEILDGKIKIDGGINAYVMYIPDSNDDSIRGININLDFSSIVEEPNCRENMILEMFTEMKSIECNVINGRKISVKAEINVRYKAFDNEKIELISDLEEKDSMQILKNSTKVNSLIGYGTTNAYVKDTITIDNTESLAEILKAKVSLVDTDIKLSYNKVLAKSEAEIKIMYLTEDNKVEVCTNKIPIVGFIDIQDVSEEDVCNTNFEIKNIIIKPNSTEDHSICIEIEIQILCMVYEKRDINLLEDLYSPIEDLHCNKKEVNVISEKQNRIENCQLNETVNLPELENGSIIDADCFPKIINTKKLNSRIIFEGDIELNFIILSNDNEIKVTKRIMPFEFTVENIEKGETLNIETRMELGENDFVIKTGGDVAINLNIIFFIDMYRNNRISVVESIEIDEKNEIEAYSLVIYVVKQGDTLWNIAKKLRSTVNDIVKANAIEDENNIKPGEKLYIPRYVKYA